jgi:hypothetical protein
MVSFVSFGYTRGLVIGTDVHVLKQSRSTYAIFAGGHRQSYCCQDGCCDSGLRSDVERVVEAAKEHGVARVILRTGLGSNYVRTIAGLPVSDVSNHVGALGDGYVVRRSYG